MRVRASSPNPSTRFIQFRAPRGTRATREFRQTHLVRARDETVVWAREEPLIRWVELRRGSNTANSDDNVVIPRKRRARHDGIKVFVLAPGTRGPRAFCWRAVRGRDNFRSWDFVRSAVRINDRRLYTHIYCVLHTVGFKNGQLICSVTIFRIQMFFVCVMYRK